VTYVNETSLGPFSAKVRGNVLVPRPFYLTKLDGIGLFRIPGTIGTLPDDPLLEVFSFYVEEAYEAYNPDGFYGIEKLEAWCTLVHVCRRWRNLVFASPRRLNLRLVCTRRKPVREVLGIWPTLPIVIDDQELGRHRQPRREHVDNIIAALEHRNRVCQISLGNIPLSLCPIFSAMMQEPFPALTRLQLNSEDESPMLCPDSFLGGSAPMLRSLTLQHIPFPALPTLLLTTKDLVELRLWSIPHSGYLSPNAMVICLSSLTKLENFILRFKSPESRPNRSIRRFSSLARATLPSLTQFRFYGVNEYIEDLVAQIDTPLLHHLSISLFGEPLFDISQLNQFVGRVEDFKVLRRAILDYDSYSNAAHFSLSEDPVNGMTLVLPISGTELEFQVPFLEALSSSSSSPLRLSSLERLDILIGYPETGRWEYYTENTPWVELLQPFTAVKDLYLDNRSVPHLSHTLQELTMERATEVLPALQRIFVQGYEQPGDTNAQETIRSFITARQLSGHPVTVHNWE